MRLSHVVYGAHDVELTAARLHDEVGLEAVRGSSFPELGLADWCIPFEDQCVELLTVTDDKLAAHTVRPVGVRQDRERRPPSSDRTRPAARAQG